MTKDMALPAGRAVVNGAASVSAVPASVPSAGDIGFADIGLSLHSYSLVRVVNAAALGRMWLVEPYQREWLSQPEGWKTAVRRKVNIWLPIGSANPAAADLSYRALYDQLWDDLRNVTAAYHENMVKAALSFSATPPTEPTPQPSA